MQIRLQIVVAVVLVLLLLYIIQKIKSRNLEIKYALSWFAAIVILLIFDLCPAIMSGLTRLIGIEMPSNLLFGLGFVFFVLIVLSITILVSKLVMQNKTLIQEVGILKKRIEQLEAKEKEDEEKI